MSLDYFTSTTQEVFLTWEISPSKLNNLFFTLKQWGKYESEDATCLSGEIALQECCTCCQL